MPNMIFKILWKYSGEFNPRCTLLDADNALDAQERFLETEKPKTRSEIIVCDIICYNTQKHED